MIGERMDKQTVIGFVALFLVLELVFYLKGLYQSMALTLAVFGIFSLLFFLLNTSGVSKSIIENIIERFKPPHKRVKSVILGNQKASNYSIIRVKAEDKEISDNESNRNSGRNDNSVKDSTSCIVKIPDNLD